MRSMKVMPVVLALALFGCRPRLPAAAASLEPGPIQVYMAGTGVAEADIRHDKAAAARWLAYLKKSIDPEKLSGRMLMGVLEAAALPGSRLRLAARPAGGDGAALRIFTSSFGLEVPKRARASLFMNVLFQLRSAGGKTLYKQKVSCLSRGQIVPAGLFPPLARWAPDDGAAPSGCRDIPEAIETLGRWCGSVITMTLIHDLRL